MLFPIGFFNAAPNHCISLCFLSYIPVHLSYFTCIYLGVVEMPGPHTRHLWCCFLYHTSSLQVYYQICRAIAVPRHICHRQSPRKLKLWKVQIWLFPLTNFSEFLQHICSRLLSHSGTEAHWGPDLCKAIWGCECWCSYVTNFAGSFHHSLLH